MRKITVVDYDPNWKLEFEKARDFYLDILEDIDVKVEHVGSTSVEGLSAKPILDIDIIVKDKADSDLVIEKLVSYGYIHIGDYGLKGREAFKYTDDNPHIKWMEHHLYVCMKDCEHVINHLLLRKHLRDNADAVKRYSELKKKLAKEFPNDIDGYVDGKTDLIISFLKAEGMQDNKLNSISDLNKLSDSDDNIDGK